MEEEKRGHYIGLLDKKYSPQNFETQILKFWEESRIYEKIRNVKRDKKYYFLDGPPYPSSDIPHIGTAWNKVMKDTIVRYRRMKGYWTWDQPGYDTHGLPIEVAVEKKLGLRSKRDIYEKVGVDRFVSECKSLALYNAGEMSRHFWDLGVSMNWEDPYYTLKNEYIESSWWLIKKAYEKGLLSRGLKVVWWCPRCETVLADYEVSEYKDLSDPSIYVKFPIRDRDASLLIWTTTPWTLPANVFVMAHPDEYYVEVSVNGEKLILMEALLDKALKGMEYEILRRFKGSELDGIQYIHPLREYVDAQKNLDDYHRVVMAPNIVSKEEGTGLVHSAPGHGEEDYEVGSKLGYPVISLVGEDGRFLPEAGKYSGKYIFDANKEIIDDLERLGALFRSDVIVHRYPICWRCKTRLLIRATEQWFLKVTSIKDDLINAIKKVEIIPEWGYERFLNWLEELRDWVISRQRFWGIPIPIWRCKECGWWIVIGSLEELKSRSIGDIDIVDLHRPWIDDVKVKCDKCGGVMERVPDVMDVWFDSGVAFFASLGYPMKKDLFDNLYPVDFITEGHDQVRGWFFSLLRAGVIGFDESPYRRVVIHGFVLDEKGREMHKSLGNYVAPTEVIERYGRDVLRFGLLQYTIWEDLKFSWNAMDMAFRELNILWNIYLFASIYMNLDKYSYDDDPLEKYLDHLLPEDRWILSRVNTVLRDVDRYLDKSMIHEALRILKDFFLNDLSRRYIRLVRWRTWLEEDDPIKLTAYSVLHYVLFNLLRMLAPFIPFITEEIYQKMFRPGLKDALESIHQYGYPEVDYKYIDRDLESKMEYIEKILEVGGAARMAIGMKFRVPIPNLYILTDDEKVRDAIRTYVNVIKSQLNVKRVEVLGRDKYGSFTVKYVEPNPAIIGPRFKHESPMVIKYIQENSVYLAEEIGESQYIEVEISGRKFRIDRDMLVFRTRPKDKYYLKEFEYGYLILDREISEEELAEGLARDVVRRIQFMRKELDLPIDAYIEAYVKAPDEYIIKLLERFKGYISNETRAKVLRFTVEDFKVDGLHVRNWDISGETYIIGIKILE